MRLEELTQACYDCLRGKKNTVGALSYQSVFEEDLPRLCREINDRTYKPSRSVAFVTLSPKPREVFAAAFRDRIIHTYIYNKIIGAMLAYLSPRSFACLNGRGTLKGIETLYHDIDVCSEHYSKDCLVMTLDIENFFMSLPKAEVAGSVTAFIGKHYRGSDIEELAWLANVIISHHPEQNCTYHCPRAQELEQLAEQGRTVEIRRWMKCIYLIKIYWNY